MSKAREVLDQIKECHTHNGNHYINHENVQKDLQSNKVYGNNDSLHKHVGFDISFDESLTIFYYSDNSALVVNSNGGLHAIGVEHCLQS